MKELILKAESSEREPKVSVRRRWRWEMEKEYGMSVGGGKIVE